MIAVLALLLLLNCALARAQEAAPVLVLPDVTLSAEDPLYLAIPPSAGWILAAPAQPPLDRRRLWAVDVPPRIRGMAALPPAPFSAPQTAGALSGGPAPDRPPRQGPPPAAEAAGEGGLRLLYRTVATAGADAWLERRLGSWEASAGAALTVSGELPSWFDVRASADWQRSGWRAGLQAAGQGVLCPQSQGFLSGSLGAQFLRDPAPFGLGSVTRLRAEQPAEAGDPWLLLSQGISGVWQGPRLGAQAGGSVFAALGENPALCGLSRAGLDWSDRALTVSAGAALLASERGLRPFPEAAVELRPWPLLRLQAGLAAYLEEPAPFLIREAFGGGERPELLPAAGLAARFAAILDAPRSGSAGISLEAIDGQRLLLRGGTLRLEDSRHLAAGAAARLALNAGGGNAPRLALWAEGSAGFPLPVSTQALLQPLYGGLGGGMEIGFAKWPAALILLARWGEVPVAGLPALLAERRELASGWQAALALRWAPRPPFTIDGGLELASGLAGRAACTWQARRSP